MVLILVVKFMSHDSCVIEILEDLEILSNKFPVGNAEVEYFKTQILKSRSLIIVCNTHGTRHVYHYII